MVNIELPELIPVFPLNNFVIFPKASVPLNIFEARYIQMVDDTIKSNKYIGIVQPINSHNKRFNKNFLNLPELYSVGCLGKITSFNETNDGRFLIELKGVIRFKILNEKKTNKNYRLFEVDYSEFYDDLNEKKDEELKFSDLELVFNDLKKTFEKKGFIINWKTLEKQNLNEIINALIMASPFALEEKQALLEAKDLHLRKDKIIEILSIYIHDNYNNTTIQ